MADVFGILTAIVLALSAFVAYKNKSSYEKARDVTLVDEQAKFAKQQDLLKTAQDSLAKIRDEVEVDIANLTKETADTKKANDDLSLEIETKTAKVNANKEQLDEVRARTEQVGDLKTLADKMRDAESEREELNQSITEAEAKLANLIAQNRQADEQAATIRTKLEAFSAGTSLPTLNTRIRSIYPTWGFVTLADGNNGGVISNSTLNVVRGGETIAKLLVTAVERNSASASIIPDSVAQGVTLMIGDRVVPATKDDATNAINASN